VLYTSADQFGVQARLARAVRYSRAVFCPASKLAEAIRNPVTISSGVQLACGGWAMACG
jgi:hypothetical protein